MDNVYIKTKNKNKVNLNQISKRENTSVRRTGPTTI